MPTLADILAGIDSVVTPAKRRLSDLMTNPVASVQQTTGLLGDKAKSFDEIVGLMVDRRGLQNSNSVMANAPQYQAAERKMTENLNSLLGSFAPVGMMIGPSAKTWNTAAAAKAEAMEKAGKHAREIWKETGTWKGPDGKWRQEIPDNTAQWRGDAFQSAYPSKANNYVGRVDMPLGGAVSHPDLFAAYPDMLHNIRTDLGRTPEWMKGSGNSGEYKPNVFTKEKISVRNETPAGGFSTMLHELQHAVQNREGFSSGGNIGQMQQSATNSGAKISEKEAYDLYRRLAGEAEARATQSRMSLNAAQRRATFPADSYDMIIESLIHK